MQLVEQGKLSLDAPIGKVLPDLAAPQVLEGFDANGEPKLRPAKNPITLRHLMTHTAGFAYDMWNGDMVQYLEKTGTPGITTCKNDALKTPIMTDPGTRWEYGTNIDFVGKAVEAVSGKRLDAYLRDHLFAPLGMTDTGFKIGDAQRKRLVGMHARGADGSLAPIPFELEQDPEFHMGGGGLYGTAGDYIKFTQMILNKGRGNGNQVLKPETVAMMGQNHIGELNMTKMTSAVAFATNDVDLYPDIVKKWGLSFLINTAKTPEGRSPGSLAWAGLANTYYWIDPARDVTGVILMQVLPFADDKCLEAFAGFERGVYAGLDAGAEGGVDARHATSLPSRCAGRGSRCGALQHRKMRSILDSRSLIDSAAQVARVNGAWRSRLDRRSADSYVCGIADAPLLGDTIGRSLDLAAQRWADREALVSPSHDVRWTLDGIRGAGRCAGRGLSRARPRTRRADRRLVAEPAGMDADAVCRRQGRAHSRHHQSRLSPHRTRIRARQGRLRRDRHRHRVQDLQLHGDAEHAAAGAGEIARRASCTRRGCRNCAR